MRESMPGCLDVGPDEERETVHAHDAYTGTGWNRSIAVIAHGPEGAAVLGLAALCGGQGDPQCHHASGGSSVNWRHLAAQLAVDAAPKRHHRDDRQNSEDGPLRPRCERWGDRRDQADYDGRAADEDEVELRVHKGQLRPEKYRAGDYPAPPAHLGALVVSGARAPSAIFQLYTEAAVRRSTHGLVDEASSPDR